MIRTSRALLALGALSLLPLSAQAHRAWMLPSATVLSGNEPWVTIDAASSNDVFYFEHNAMGLEGVTVTGPTGGKVEMQNAGKGRYRSTFDFQLKEQGTYKVANVSDGFNANYKVGTETKRWRGTAAEAATAIPAGATDVKLSQNSRRIEVFATLGKPNDTVLKPTGVGLELVPTTHPNDLFAGETAKFALVLDGKPAKGVEVIVIQGGIRYRDKLGEIKTTTADDGTFSVTWPEAGMYWLNANVRGGASSVPNATRSAQYTATLEVQKP